MAEYIDREALLHEYDQQHEGPPGKARKLIERFPAADVQPVKFAEWVMHYYEPDKPFILYCSDCGAYLPWVNFWQPNYCPMCGAKMMEATGG